MLRMPSKMALDFSACDNPSNATQGFMHCLQAQAVSCQLVSASLRERRGILHSGAGYKPPLASAESGFTAILLQFSFANWIINYPIVSPFATNWHIGEL